MHQENMEKKTPSSKVQIPEKIFDNIVTLNLSYMFKNDCVLFME